MVGRRRFGALVATFVVGVSCLVASATPAAAVSHWPAPPSGIRLVSIAPTSLTVVADRASNVSRYKVFVSTAKDDLYVDSLRQARTTRTMASSSQPRITVRGLRYVAVPYYYRFATTNWPHMRVSSIRSVNLRPTAPTAVQLASSSAGAFLTWTSVAATGFTIAQSTDPAMQADRRDYAIRGQARQFTPYSLSPGTTYYFRVSAINSTTRSSYSAEVSAPARAGEQPLRVMTYNILADGVDGQQLTGERIAPWNTKRKPAAAALVRRGDPDILAVEEGASWTNGYRSPRQVDSLRSALGSTYSLAATETPPTQPKFGPLTGDYVIYRNTAYETVGAGGHWSIGDGLFAVDQVLRNKASGATFLVVATHLRAGVSAAYDRLRLTQTQNVLSRAREIAARDGNLPVILAGDFNSYLSSYHPADAPSRVMLPALMNEAYYLAPTRWNAQFNTVNMYRRIAPKGVISIDRIFASPGVAVRAWAQLLNISAGRFVGTIPSDHNPVFADLTVPF